MGPGRFLKTLGIPELLGADGRPVKLKVRKHLAVLIYLAADYRGAHRREELVELFWSEVDAERGRHSLSVALSVLRTALPPGAIASTNTHVQLLRSALTVDLDLLGRGEIFGDAGSVPIEVDRFLLDFEIEGAPAFHHWRDRQHAQLLPTIQAGLLRLIDHARRSGDMTRVLALAERLLALDSLAEEGIRAKMHALAMQGDRVSALRAYEDWKAELVRELGAVPSELLEAVAARLRGRHPGRVAERVVPSVHTEHWADRKFVGRTAEFRELFDAWEATTQLDTRHVLITGETGIGKSTLAMRFGTAAALEGAAVARVQCFELEQRIPFGMIGALVVSLLDRPGAIATAPESLAEIARVVPGVRERFPNLPPPRPLEGEAARLHFAEGVFALFDAIMDEQPLVLIVDDYPRSDEASLAVLHMMLRRVTGDRLMVVLAGRPPEPDEPGQARRIRQGVSYLPMRHLELKPLPESDSEEMLGLILGCDGHGPSAPARRAILMAGSGNPMALDLLAQDWAAHGDASLAISLPAMQSDMPASALEAVGSDRLLERLLPELAPRTRTALYLAAILGPRLNDLECFEIADLTAAETMAAMIELVGRRVLRDVGAGLEFVNELIRARLYLKIPAAARTRMHDRVATRLLAAAAVGETVPGLEIAWHCIRARRREEAVPYLMSGARDAILHGAPDEAARALGSAVGSLKGQAKDEAILLLAEAYQEMGQWKSLLSCLEELNGSRQGKGYVAEMAYALRATGRVETEGMSIDEKLLVAKDLIQRASDPNGHPVARTEAALTAVLISARYRAKSLLVSVQRVLRQFPTIDIDQRTRARFLLANGVINYHCRGTKEGYQQALIGTQVLEAAGAADATYVRLQIGLGVFATVWGDYAEAQLRDKLAYVAACRLDNTHLMACAAANLAHGYQRIGEPELQLHWAKLAGELSQILDSVRYERVMSLSLECTAHLSLGRPREAERSLQRLRAAKTQVTSRWIFQAAVLFEAEIVWLMGQRLDALRIAKEAWDSDTDPPPTGFEGRWVQWKTHIYLNESRIEDLNRLLDSYYREIARFDLLDQAEILCCIAYSRRQTGCEVGSVAHEAQATLARLPIACSTLLEQLGLLLPLG